MGGFHGTRGSGGPADDNTGYIAPTRDELLDWNIVYDFDYALVLGTLRQIRAYAAAHRPPVGPDWQFSAGRDGFSTVNASDSGFPMHDVLRVSLDGQDPQLLSPTTFWRAEDVPAVDVRMAVHARAAQTAAVLWETADGGEVQGQAAFPIVADGSFRTYRVRLAGSPGYAGVISAASSRPDRVGRGGRGAGRDRLDHRGARRARRAHPRPDARDRAPGCRRPTACGGTVSRVRRQRANRARSLGGALVEPDSLGEDRRERPLPHPAARPRRLPRTGCQTRRNGQTCLGVTSELGLG